MGISHPAGFPLYSLLAKAVTFVPFGTIAFKVNLFSVLFACGTLVALYFAAIRLLSNLYAEEDPSHFVWPAFLATGLLAFSVPFWLHSLVAEVYTLHAFIICVLILLLLAWREKEDVRYLYGAALLYGLGAGNHATVAFLLPAILLLFFAWNRKDTARHLSVCVAFFMIGLSVYSYLPIRSLTEPSMDWGNPETVQRFLYQVTDRKDAATHFSVLRQSGESAETGALGAAGAAMHKVWRVVRSFGSDVSENLTGFAMMGFVAGTFFCWRKNRPLFLFFFLIVAVNAAFFAHWREESFFPSYIVVCLFTAIALYGLIFRKRTQEAGAPQARLHPALAAIQKAFSQMDWRKAAVPVFLCVIGWNAFTGYPRVDRSDLYFGETLLKRVFLSIENRGVFITGNSWFDYFYNQDVVRLRDDVTAIKAWDFLDPDPPSILTARRYPDLNLPDPAGHTFQSREGAYRYLNAFFAANQQERPILMDQNLTFFEQLPLERRFETYKNILLKLETAPDTQNRQDPGDRAFEEFKLLMTDELQKPGIERTEWITKISFYIPSFARYFHANGRYSEERAALKLMHDFLGQRGLPWLFTMTDNLILDGKFTLAEAHLEMMRERFPNHYETHLAQGLLHSAKGEYKKSIHALQTAAGMNPAAFRPFLEMATAYHRMGANEQALKERERAQSRIRNLGDLEKVRGLPVG